MTKQNSLTFTLLILLSFACSSPTYSPENRIFNTYIRDDNSKIFTLFLTQKTNSHKAKNKQSTKKSNQNNPDKKQPQNKKQQRKSPSVNRKNELSINNELREHLSEVLAETGFCRQGYIELEIHIGKGLAKIKGECHESASSADRESYPNKSKSE